MCIEPIMTMVQTLLSLFKGLSEIFIAIVKSIYFIFSYFTCTLKTIIGFLVSDISVPQTQVVYA